MSQADRSGTAVLPMPDLSSTFPGPFPASPHADHIEQHVGQWLRRFPLLGPPDGLRTLCNIVGQGVARTFPTADPDSLSLCADLFLWLTAFDDVHGETRAADDLTQLVRRVGEFVHLLADGEPPGDADPFGAALQDLLERLRSRATPAQYLRVTGCLRDTLFGILWEAHHLPVADRVTVRDYLAIRPHTVFVRTLMATAEIALRYELPEETRNAGAVRQLESALADLAGLMNDLGSYARESAQGGPQSLNLIALIMNQRNCDLATAFAEASRMGEERAAIVRARITELTDGGTGLLAGHALAMESIACSYVWHIEHARYAID
ncbi:terpene synthase family protein [Peterkaempfera sp. SMS 1(5)a]|uniref:terpene synthase family protein n=1 Tax=Peterkaempfera podocarpi TaxID=3232308 RepID=UPI00366CBC2F